MQLRLSLRRCSRHLHCYMRIFSCHSRCLSTSCLAFAPRCILRKIPTTLPATTLHSRSVLRKALFHESVVNAGPDGIVLVRDIDFASTCEATLLPFLGRCHVAYFPSNSVVLGLSKLARLTKILAKRLQTQERLTAQLLQVRMA